MPHGQFSAFRHAAYQRLVSNSARSSLRLSLVSISAVHAEIFLCVIPARGGIHCGTRSSPIRPGTVLVPAFTSVLFAAEGVDHQLEVLWAAGDPDGLLGVNPILFDQFQQGLVEGLHAVVFALRDGLLDLAGLGRVHDEVPDAPCGDHYLADGCPVPAFRADQTLSNYALDRARYHGAHLVPLVRWEEIYQAVYGLGSIQGVERTEDQVAGLGRREGHLGAFGVPDLAYQYHVGVLPKHTPQGPRKGGCIRTHLALVYDALVVSMNELYGVLDGNHVLGDGVIDHVYHRGERRRLAAARGARDQDDSALLEGEGADHLGQPQRLEFGDLEGDKTHRYGDPAPLPESVDPE